MTRALVLGGGGVTGVAWELGVLRGLEAAGVAVADADLVVGTSAGAVVGAQLTSGIGLDRLLQAQYKPPEATKERPAELDLEALGALWLELAQTATSPEDLRAKLGARALAAGTVPEAERIEIIVSRLPVTEWPERPLLVTAVDVATGEFKVFDRHAGVPLTLAVAASCAVPMVWPPVRIDGRRYMDGGTRSLTNADLAAGHDTVLVVAPVAELGLGPLMPGLGSELATLGPGRRVEVITPDDAALAAIGPNVLDPSRSAGAARAGLAQGEREAARVMALWTAPEAPPAAG
ncbi:MAG TPA: patatin-like phospholipase family protein [Actinomycetes bacterium]|jgi:NTE family protein|nr:patatin-like phospholipase family protein [Actinomycetes bacterium]